MIFIDRHSDAAGALNGVLVGSDYVARLESRLGAMFGRNAVAMSSVDAALHTALHLCGVNSGDYVIVPTFTFYSFIATVEHVGAVPVFIDCEPTTRCMSPAALETALMWARLQDKPPKAIIVDNAFGAVADYNKLVPLAKAWNVPTIELAVGVFGGAFEGKPLGANCEYGIVGFNRGLDGGGGALVCEDSLRAREFGRICYSEHENHDYRLHNAVAALDCAQLNVIDKISARSRSNLAALCSSLNIVAPPTDGDAAVFAVCRAGAFAQDIYNAGFDVKMPPLVHELDRYSGCAFFEHEQGFCAAKTYSDCCLIGTDITKLRLLKLIRLIKSFTANGQV